LITAFGHADLALVRRCLLQIIGVVGAGQMGSGIAQVCAAKGLEVLITDRSQELLDRSVNSIRKSLQRLTNKGTLEKTTADEALSRIRAESSLDVSASHSSCSLADKLHSIQAMPHAVISCRDYAMQILS
jgi:3-hydroxyacyl-CoA dehydrogenase